MFEMKGVISNNAVIVPFISDWIPRFHVYQEVLTEVYLVPNCGHWSHYGRPVCVSTHLPFCIRLFISGNAGSGGACCRALYRGRYNLALTHTIKPSLFSQQDMRALQESRLVPLTSHGPCRVFRLALVSRCALILTAGGHIGFYKKKFKILILTIAYRSTEPTGLDNSSQMVA